MPTATATHKDVLQEIKSKLSLYSNYANLRSSGSGYIGRCPFHNDHNPSFSVYQSGDFWLWKCFACNVGGSIIDLELRHEGTNPDTATKQERATAIKRLDEKAGISFSDVVPPTRPFEAPLPADPTPEPEPTKLEATEERVQEYVRNLADQPEDSEVKQFLTRSGIDEKTASDLKLGYSESKYFKDGNYPALVIPLYWECELVGLKYRNLQPPDKDHKWTQAKGSKGDFLWQADLPPADPNSTAVAIFEGVRDTALARALGFNATGILSVSSISDSERFQESVNRIKQTYQHAILVGDNDEPGKEAMDNVREYFEHGAVFCRLPKGVKDLSEFYEKSGGEAVSAWLRQVNSVMSGFRPFSGNLPASESGFVSVTMSDVTPKNVEWLWLNKIAKNKLTVFGGNPDTGKSTVAYDLIARVTTGKDFPDSSNENAPQHVLLMSAEDDPEDTIRPRLDAAGANPEFVHLLKGIRLPKGAKSEQRHIALDSDVAELKREIEKRGNIGLVVIDPISSYVGKIDMNKEVEVRNVLGPLKDIAEKTNTAVLAIAHFNKRNDVDAIHKIAGAVAMSGLPRAVWVFLKNPDARNERIMALSKNNATDVRTGLKYGFEKVTMQGINTSRIVWGDKYDDEADSAMEKERDPYGRKEAIARKFLKEMLADNDATFEQVAARANNEGISMRTVYEAKKDLGIFSQKRMGGQHWWHLPKESAKESEEPFKALLEDN